MSAASQRAHFASLVEQRLCIVCEAPRGDHVRCDDCHEWHLANERKRNPPRGIKGCSNCKQKGHYAPRCPTPNTSNPSVAASAA